MKRHCPICRKPTDSETDADFPFCSERCRTHDLGNWASEKYKITEPVIDEVPIDESVSDESNAPRKTSPRDANGRNN